MESDEMRWSMDKSSSLGMPMSPQEISKRYKCQSLWMPRGTPSSSAKIRSPFKTLYFYCFIFYAFFLECLYFCFQFSFVLFVAINVWTPTNFFWRRHTSFFIAKNTLVFTLIIHRLFSFSSTAFSFHFFALIFVQILLYLCMKVYLDHWSISVFLKRVVSKSFMTIVVQMGACLDLGLYFCMSCLMSFW
jgi:hypothetical protein